MQYPKMLYKGSQAKYTYEIAQHEAHEDELREQGWIGFYDLPINADQPETNYEEMTSEELRDLLEEKGIEFKVRDSKATLIKLLEN